MKPCEESCDFMVRIIRSRRERESGLDLEEDNDRKEYQYE